MKAKMPSVASVVETQQAACRTLAECMRAHVKSLPKSRLAEAPVIEHWADLLDSIAVAMGEALRDNDARFLRRMWATAKQQALPLVASAVIGGVATGVATVEAMEWHGTEVESCASTVVANADTSQNLVDAWTPPAVVAGEGSVTLDGVTSEAGGTVAQPPLDVSDVEAMNSQFPGEHQAPDEIFPPRSTFPPLMDVEREALADNEMGSSGVGYQTESIGSEEARSKWQANRRGAKDWVSFSELSADQHRRIARRISGFVSINSPAAEDIQALEFNKSGHDDTEMVTVHYQPEANRGPDTFAAPPGLFDDELSESRRP